MKERDEGWFSLQIVCQDIVLTCVAIQMRVIVVLV